VIAWRIDWRGDLGGALLLAAGFLSLIGAAELWRKLGQASPESTRKLAHLGAGVGCLALPFLVRSPWVVLVLALSLSGLFALGARYGFLPSLHSVERRTRGSEYYPIAIFLLFVVYRDQPAFYVSAVLVLAVADAFAALIGVRYGVVRYEVEDSTRSLEGSVVFLLIAFLAIHLPLLLMTDLGRAQTVLAALLIAALVTAFEAISLSGADNLFIPIAVAVGLDKITSKPLAEAVYQNLSLAAVTVTCAVIVHRARWFNTGATLVIILYAYGAWALGSWLWSLPVIAALVAALVFGLRAGRRGHASQKVRATAAALLPPFLFLAASNASAAGPAQDPFFGPYLAALAAAIGCWIRAQSALFRADPAERPRPRSPRLGLLTAVAIAAALVVAVVPWLLEPDRSITILAVTCAAAAAAVVGESIWTWLFAREAPARRWTARRFLFSLAAGALVMALQQAGAVESWRPSRTVDPQRLFWEPPRG
jgi:phytol kinase